MCLTPFGGNGLGWVNSGYNVSMRCDRGTTLATILILMCCVGGSVGSSTMVSHRVLIRTVSQHANTVLVEVCTASLNLEDPTIWNPQVIDGNLLPLADIEELHNLPPPAIG